MVRAGYAHIIDPELIASAAAAAAGERPHGLVRLKQNRSRVTCEVMLSGGRRAYLKAETRTPGKSFSLALEAWALEQAAAVGVPVPAPLALDCSESRFPFRWLLLSALPGVHLTDANLGPVQEAAVLRECGEFLTRLHGIRTDGFGPLDDELYLSTGIVRGSEASWRSFILRQARSDAGLLAGAGLLSESEAEGCLTAVAAGVPEREQGWLTHGDFDRGHVFVNPATGRLLGVIDFGARESADPEWELSWPSIFDTEEAAAATMQGYREAGGRLNPAVLDCYILVRLLWLTRWRHDAADPAAGAAWQRLQARLSANADRRA